MTDDTPGPTREWIERRTIDGAARLAERLSREGRSDDSKAIDLLLDLCDRLRIERDRARSAYESLRSSTRR
jgi:hypothetical protein